MSPSALYQFGRLFLGFPRAWPLRSNSRAISLDAFESDTEKGQSKAHASEEQSSPPFFLVVRDRAVFFLLLFFFSSRRPLGACSPPGRGGEFNGLEAFKHFPTLAHAAKPITDRALGSREEGSTASLAPKSGPPKEKTKQPMQPSFFPIVAFFFLCFFHSVSPSPPLRNEHPFAHLSTSSHLGDLARRDAGGGGRGGGGLGGEAAERRAEGRGGGGRGLGGRFREHASAGRGDAGERVPGRRGRGTRSQAPQGGRAGHGNEFLGFLFPDGERKKRRFVCKEKKRPLLLRPRPRPPLSLSLLSVSLLPTRSQRREYAANRKWGLLQMKSDTIDYREKVLKRSFLGKKRNEEDNREREREKEKESTTRHHQNLLLLSLFFNASSKRTDSSRRRSTRRRRRRAAGRRSAPRPSAASSCSVRFCDFSSFENSFFFVNVSSFSEFFFFFF